MLCLVITFVPGVESLTNRVQSFDLLKPQSTPSCSIFPSPAASTSGIYSSIFDLNRPYLNSALKEKLDWGIREIKAANILLTQDFEPQVDEFLKMLDEEVLKTEAFFINKEAELLKRGNITKLNLIIFYIQSIINKARI
ncbi:unnamed protein product [Lactuca virosa]|uniref:Uncharacterized protein n=1 Tax=Lactuca virosa TaxID=75947 RepID=A0AAU9P7N0_9ASTR|nr:unnamed protein product [Lactuca virosa]CAH1446228.1 unnamed protein product [Lactuca virosa]